MWFSKVACNFLWCMVDFSWNIFHTCSKARLVWSLIGVVYFAFQVGETEPFVCELLKGLPTTILDLEAHQIHTFYEAVCDFYGPALLASFIQFHHGFIKYSSGNQKSGWQWLLSFDAGRIYDSSWIRPSKAGWVSTEAHGAPKSGWLLIVFCRWNGFFSTVGFMTGYLQMLFMLTPQ